MRNTSLRVDNCPISSALPQMHIDLGFSTTGLSWVQNAYTLAFGGLLLLGRRRERPLYCHGYGLAAR